MGRDASPMVIGVDLGGSKILSVVVNARGKIISRDLRVTPSSQGPEAVIQAVLRSVRWAIAQAGISTSPATTDSFTPWKARRLRKPTDRGTFTRGTQWSR